ncbi:MAG: FAD-binding protein, partial [Burkholderiaceae bacterium]|nr:FAD-binding protein [Burkholderiaceae bacterium]
MIWDAIIIGGGAAGLFCAGIAGQLGKKVLVLDHAPVLGEKIRISGGGRCNFTNLHSAPEHFLSLNPHFVKSPLARYSSKDFINLVREYRIPFHEKHRGQLFCNNSAKDIIQMLLTECQKGDVTVHHPVSVTHISQTQSHWSLETTDGIKKATHLIIATGGLPVPAIGASDFGLQIAKQFEIPTTDALFSEADKKNVDTILAEALPQRVAQLLTEQLKLTKRNWAEVSKKDREVLRTHLTKAQMKPAGTLGWKKAEVMLGGIDTKALDGKTMMAKNHQNLYFIGECVDITGHLGG